jgi:hypothetical protein
MYHDGIREILGVSVIFDTQGLLYHKEQQKVIIQDFSPGQSHLIFGAACSAHLQVEL